jgi:hypothetical protein
MADRLIYFGIENMNLTDEDRALLVAALDEIPPLSHSQPSHTNHRRVRLDADAAIYRGLWNEDHITIATFKDKLGAIFSVDPATIDHAVQTPTFDARESDVVTFSRTGKDYLRVVFFGYPGGADWPTPEQSRIEVIAYLYANAEAWGEEVA